MRRNQTLENGHSLRSTSTRAQTFVDTALAPRREPIAAPPDAPQAAIDTAKRRLGDLTRSGCLSLGRVERDEV